MIKSYYIVAFISLLLIIFTPRSFAVDPRLDWKTVETTNFYIHYALGYEQLAQKVANAAEQAHQKLKPEINWQADEKTHLVISDQTDRPNGYATPLYFNRSVLFMAPPTSANTLEDFDDWLEILIEHEYTHVLHLDKAHGAPDKLRNIFGRHFLLFPNLYQPNWITEGLATYYETDLNKGIGRGQSSLYEAMMYTEIENGIKPVTQINLPIKSWPMGIDAYLYGVYFYQFIEDVYGEEKIDLLVEKYSYHIVPFMINTNTQQVFDKDIETLWGEFGNWLRHRFRLDVEDSNETPRVEGVKLTDLGYSTKSVDMVSEKQILYVADGAFKHAALMKINYKDNKHENKIVDVHSGALINTHPRSGTLITQVEFCDEYNLNSDIYHIGTDGKELTRLTECGRFQSASWSSDGESIIAVKIDKAQSQLLMLNKKGETQKVLWRGNATDIVSQLDWSPAANKIVAAVFRTASGWNIEEFNLENNEWSVITNDRYIDMYPSYSDNGESILFSSDRSGRYQIYRYVKGSKELQKLTEVTTAAFKPVQLNQKSSLYYSGYGGNGYDIFKLDKVDVLNTVKISNDNQREVKLAEEVSISAADDYSALKSLSPRWWFPFISLNEDRNEYGISTSGGDALSIHNYLLDIAYDTSNEWFIGNLSYSYAQNIFAGYSRSTDIYRDSNGDFALARNVNDVFVSLTINYPGVENSISYQLGALMSESSDGYRAAGITEQPDSKNNLLGVAAIFNNTQKYIRSISPADGRAIRLLAESSGVLDSNYSGEVYTLDWREYLSLGQQHVLAIRLVQGWGTENPESFRLGGEDNDYGILDLINPVGESLFGVRDYALRGYAEGLPQLNGRRMQLGSLEWRFPGALIERGWMSPPIGIIQWSGSVFTEAGAAYDGSSADDYYSSIGVEVQADINLFYRLTSRMRLGYASGLDESIGDDRLYFMLGASF